MRSEFNPYESPTAPAEEFAPRVHARRKARAHWMFFTPTLLIGLGMCYFGIKDEEPQYSFITCGLLQLAAGFIGIAQWRRARAQQRNLE